LARWDAAEFGENFGSEKNCVSRPKVLESVAVVFVVVLAVLEASSIVAVGIDVSRKAKGGKSVAIVLAVVLAVLEASSIVTVGIDDSRKGKR